jgi:hypothetical protein
MNNHCNRNKYAFGTLLFVATGLASAAPQIVSQNRSLSESQLATAIQLAGDYLVRSCGPNGRFEYKVDTVTRAQSVTYDIVRHAGAMYALEMLYAQHPDPRTLDAVKRSALFLEQNYIGPTPEPETLAVWARPLPFPTKTDLGATGLGLVALATLEKIKPGSVAHDKLQGLGNFMLLLQREDGSFANRYYFAKGPDKEFESLYYPGEAALGLIALYEVDHSQKWLKAAGSALNYLATSRTSLDKIPPDHWALIATAKLLPICVKTPCGVSEAILLHHAEQVCNALMTNQVRTRDGLSANGAFDPTGRTTSTATRMEGLLAALQFSPNGSFRMSIESVVRNGIDFLLRAQISSGTYSGGLPRALSLTAPDATQVRIDYVQHALCAFILYQHLVLSRSK